MLPVRFLFVLLLVIAVLAIGVWWIVTPGKMPPGDSNIAIVEFGQKDAAGNVKASSQGTYLSQWLYNRMNDEIAELPKARSRRFGILRRVLTRSISLKNG